MPFIQIVSCLSLSLLIGFKWLIVDLHDVVDVEKHEENHRPSMNKGVVIKQNANQRYATTSVTSVVLREAAKVRNTPLQEFVVRNDSPCGSTIGPMLSSKLGVRTVDVGNPQLSMHSIREQCGTDDVQCAIDLFEVIYNFLYPSDSIQSLILFTSLSLSIILRSMLESPLTNQNMVI